MDSQTLWTLCSPRTNDGCCNTLQCLVVTVPYTSDAGSIHKAKSEKNKLRTPASFVDAGGKWDAMKEREAAGRGEARPTCARLP